MKKLVLAAALVAVSAPAFAGSLAPATMEPSVVVEQTAASSSSAGVLIPLVMLALIAAAAAD
jgi:hypothetical protein